MTLILLWFSGIISALLASSLGGGTCFNLPGIIASSKWIRLILSSLSLSIQLLYFHFDCFVFYIFFFCYLLRWQCCYPSSTCFWIPKAPTIKTGTNQKLILSFSVTWVIFRNVFFNRFRIPQQILYSSLFVCLFFFFFF